MRVIEQSYEILTNIDSKKILQIIEYCARTCYQSYGNQTDDSCYSFVKMLMTRHHESCLEHYSFSVKFIVDRGIHNELVRHRLSSINAESSRYVNYSKDKFGKEITVIKPSFLEGGTEPFNIWLSAMKCAEAEYMTMLSLGCKPEEARTVLPLSIKTETVITANIREWRHILKMRTTDFCHPQMKSIMRLLLDDLKKRIPIVFDDITY